MIERDKNTPKPGTTERPVPKGYRMIRAEFPIPDDADASDVLERVTELAVGLAEEFHEDPDDEDSGEAFDSAVFDDRVSVQEVWR